MPELPELPTDLSFITNLQLRAIATEAIENLYEGQRKVAQLLKEIKRDQIQRLQNSLQPVPPPRFAECDIRALDLSMQNNIFLQGEPAGTPQSRFEAFWDASSNPTEEGSEAVHAAGLDGTSD